MGRWVVALVLVGFTALGCGLAVLLGWMVLSLGIHPVTAIPIIVGILFIGQWEGTKAYDRFMKWWEGESDGETCSR